MAGESEFDCCWHEPGRVVVGGEGREETKEAQQAGGRGGSGGVADLPAVGGVSTSAIDVLGGAADAVLLMLC